MLTLGVRYWCIPNNYREHFQLQTHFYGILGLQSFWSNTDTDISADIGTDTGIGTNTSLTHTKRVSKSKLSSGTFGVAIFLIQYWYRQRPVSCCYLCPARPWRRRWAGPVGSCVHSQWEAGSTSRPGSQPRPPAGSRSGPETLWWTGRPRPDPTPGPAWPCNTHRGVRGQRSADTGAGGNGERSSGTDRSWGWSSESRMLGMGR